MTSGITRPEESVRPTSIRWRIFALLFAVSVVNFIDRGSLSVALPDITREFGLSSVQAGYLLSAFFWAYALAQIPCAWLVDRLRARELLTGTAVAWAIAQAGTGLCGGLGAMVVCRGALGLAEGPFYPISGKVNGRWLTGTERSRGATIVNSGATLGNAIGAFVMAWLITIAGGWRNAFVITGGVGVLVALLIWWYLRESPAAHRGVNAAERAYIERGTAAEPGGDAGRVVRVAELARRPTFWWICIGWFCYGTIFFGLLTWGPEYLSERGFGLTGVGDATLIIFLSGFVGALAGGWVSDRWIAAGGRRATVLRTMFTVAGVMSLAGLVGVTVVGSAVAAVACLSVVVFFWQFVTIYWALPPMLANAASVGKVGSLMNLGSQIGAVISPIVVGYIRQWTGGFAYAMYYFVAISVLFVIVSALIRYDRGLTDPTPARLPRPEAT